jgi:hypothetical protein
MVNSKAIQTFLAYKGHPCFTFYTKTENPIKSLIRHLPNKNSSEDITVALQELRYEVICFKQMTTTHPSPEEDATRILLPFFLITLAKKNQKSEDIFKLPKLYNKIIKVQANKS